MIKFKPTDIYTLPPTDKHDIYAIKGVFNGTATPEQQQRAFDWIVKKLCQVVGLPFVPGHPDVTNFKQGQQYVGYVLTQIVTDPNLLPLVEPKPKTRRKNDRTD